MCTVYLATLAENVVTILPTNQSRFAFCQMPFVNQYPKIFQWTTRTVKAFGARKLISLKLVV